MKLSRVLKDRYFLLLACCAVISSIVALWYLSNQTVFGYDQARDAFYAHSILFNHDFKIIGPTTDIVGVNHGVAWYYFLSIPYFLARQDPQIAVFFLYLLSIGSLPFVWKLSQKLFSDRRISFVATVLYSFSPLVIAMSSWMSNPVLSLYITPPLLLLIWDFNNKTSLRKSFLTGVLYGILIQAEIANVLFLATIPMFVFFLKIKFKISQAAIFILGLTLTLSTYLMVELKFGGRGIKAIIEFIAKSHGSNSSHLNQIFGKYVEFFQQTLFPFQNAVVIILFLISILGFVIAFKKAKRPLTFILIWLSNILLFTLFDSGISHSYFVFIPSIAAGVIFISFLTVKYLRINLLLAIFMLIVIFFQVKTINEWVEDDYSPAAIQRSNTIMRYKQVVDYTYASAKGQPFIINASTNPLYIGTTWEYLYEFYGKQKYGYVPFWGGRSQQGYPGNLPEKPYGEKYRYLILESSIGMDDIYPIKAVYDEDKVSDIIETKNFGYVTVQMRLFHENKGPIEIPAKLKNSPVLYE